MAAFTLGLSDLKSNAVAAPLQAPREGTCLQKKRFRQILGSCRKGKRGYVLLEGQGHA